MKKFDFYLVSKKKGFGSAGNRPLSMVFVSPSLAFQHFWKEFLHQTRPNFTFRPVPYFLSEKILIDA